MTFLSHLLVIFYVLRLGICKDILLFGKTNNNLKYKIYRWSCRSLYHVYICQILLRCTIFQHFCHKLGMDSINLAYQKPNFNPPRLKGRWLRDIDWLQPIQLMMPGLILCCQGHFTQVESQRLFGVVLSYQWAWKHGHFPYWRSPLNEQLNVFAEK